MQGVSREGFAASQRALDEALGSGADWSALSDDLFAVVDVLDGSAMLRRAVSDPSRDPQAKAQLVERLLSGKVSPAALAVVRTAAGQRWSAERDLTDGLEQLAVQTQVAIADAAGRGNEVEEQLFRFERAVAADNGLRDALSDSALPADRKVSVVKALLTGKAAPETVRLAEQAVAAPRGRKFATTIADYLKIAADKRQQLAAVVTVAQPLTPEQHDRLAAALAASYGKPVMLNVVLDPGVVGGIRVAIGDEVLDGTISRRIDIARRHFGG